MFNEIKIKKKTKKISFNNNIQIRYMRVWDFAYRNARKSSWEIIARDRQRFATRITRIGRILEPILQKFLKKNNS